MTQETSAATTAPKNQITLERTFAAPLSDIWELWTTQDGIEAWWGPEGFSVAVLSLDLRPAGKLVYAMTATGPDQVAFMKQAQMPLTTETRLTYTEVTPQSRLAYNTTADFIPGVAPYDVGTVITFAPSAEGVRMELVFDAMHDAHWTEMSRMGHEGELDKLEALLAARKG